VRIKERRVPRDARLDLFRQENHSGPIRAFGSLKTQAPGEQQDVDAATGPCQPGEPMAQFDRTTSGIIHGSPKHSFDASTDHNSRRARVKSIPESGGNGTRSCPNAALGALVRLERDEWPGLRDVAPIVVGSESSRTVEI